MTDALRRLNHWVPEAYLRAFTATDGLLQVYRRSAGTHHFRAAPSAIAKERDLYVIKRDGKFDDTLERLFADSIEAPFVPIRNRIVFGRDVGFTNVLTVKEESTVALYVAFQALRTPRTRDKIKLMTEFHASAMLRGRLLNVRQAQRDFERALGRPSTEQEIMKMREALDEGRIVPHATQTHWLKMVFELSQKLAEIIARLPRRIMYVPDGIQLPTSDDPVVLVRRHTSQAYVHEGGWDDPFVEVTFPLSPACVLVIGGALTTFDDQGTRGWFDQVRHRIISGANEWVFSPREDAAIPTVLAKAPRPVDVVAYPGGRVERGEPIMPAVIDMMNTNPGRATIAFGTSSRHPRAGASKPEQKRTSSRVRKPPGGGL